MTEIEKEGVEVRQMTGMGKMNRLGYNKAGILTRIKRERKGQGREREDTIRMGGREKEDGE